LKKTLSGPCRASRAAGAGDAAVRNLPRGRRLSSRAEAAYSRLLSSFHDLNELSGQLHHRAGPRLRRAGERADWRAHRVRTVLQYVFEKHFEFAFESLRRKTLELATKQLFKNPRDLSPVRPQLHAAIGLGDAR